MDYPTAAHTRTTQADQNIEEAISACNTALSMPQPSSSAASTLSSARARVSEIASELQMHASRGPDASAKQLAARKPQLTFWLTAAAVAAFVDAEGGGDTP